MKALDAFNARNALIRSMSLLRLMRLLWFTVLNAVYTIATLIAVNALIPPSVYVALKSLSDVIVV